MRRTGRRALGLIMFALSCAPAAKVTDAGGDAAIDGADDVTGAADDAGADADPGVFAWAEAAPCPVARFEANGAVVGGELWVLGGFTAATLEVTRRVDIYDPIADGWRDGPDLPGAETHIAVVPVGRDLVVAGGFAGRFTPSSRPLTTGAVWRWSAANAAWNVGPPLPIAGAAFSWALTGTQLHLAGGLDQDGNTDSTIHFVWDLAGASQWTGAAVLPTGRNHGGGTAAGGLFYAIAGRHSWNEQSGDVTDVDAFDPRSGLWSARAPIPTARSEIAASTSTMPDGRILVVGGSLAGVVPSAEVLVYDPALDSWSALPSLPQPRKGAVATRIGRRIIVTTGSPTSIDPSATTFVGCCL